MQELIERIQKDAGISEQQAMAAAEAAKSFIKSKVPPMFNGLVDQLFSGKFDAASAMKAAQQRQADFMDKAKETMSSAGDKVQDFTKEAVDKSADFARQATDYLHHWAKQAGGWSEEAFEKFKEMFGSQKPSGNPNDDAGAGNQSNR